MTTSLGDYLVTITSTRGGSGAGKDGIYGAGGGGGTELSENYTRRFDCSGGSVAAGSGAIGSGVGGDAALKAFGCGAGGGANGSFQGGDGGEGYCQIWWYE